MNHSLELILRFDSVRFDSVYSGLSGFHSDSILIKSYSIGFGSICVVTRSGLTLARLVKRVLFWGHCAFKKRYKAMARDMRPFWERMSRTMALYRFDPIRLDSIQFVPIGYVYEPMARDMRPFWDRMSRTMALYRFDPIRSDSNRSETV